MLFCNFKSNVGSKNLVNITPEITFALLWLKLANVKCKKRVKSIATISLNVSCKLMYK